MRTQIKLHKQEEIASKVMERNGDNETAKEDGNMAMINRTEKAKAGTNPKGAEGKHEGRTEETKGMKKQNNGSGKRENTYQIVPQSG